MPPLPLFSHSSDRTRDPSQCRPCSACCIWLPIPAGVVGPGAKAAGTSCPHLGVTGCRIYGQHPELCVDFGCAWLGDNSWPQPWRPDRSGLMCLREQIGGRWAAAVYEIRPDALQRPPAVEILEELRQTTAVYVLIGLQQRRRCLPGRLTDDRPQTVVSIRRLQRVA